MDLPQTKQPPPYNLYEARINITSLLPYQTNINSEVDLQKNLEKHI